MKRDRRTRLDIYYDMLKTLEDEEYLNITRISDGAHLNHSKARQFLNVLIDRELVKELEDEYRLTEKGVEFLRLFEDIKELMEGMKEVEDD